MSESLFEASLRDRIERAVELLNESDPDEFIEYFTEDVKVIVPVYRAGDALGAPEFSGRSEFRAFPPAASHAAPAVSPPGCRQDQS